MSTLTTNNTSAGKGALTQTGSQLMLSTALASGVSSLANDRGGGVLPTTGPKTFPNSNIQGAGSQGVGGDNRFSGDGGGGPGGGGPRLPAPPHTNYQHAMPSNHETLALGNSKLLI